MLPEQSFLHERQIPANEKLQPTSKQAEKILQQFSQIYYGRASR